MMLFSPSVALDCCCEGCSAVLEVSEGTEGRREVKPKFKTLRKSEGAFGRTKERRLTSGVSLGLMFGVSLVLSLT